MSYDTTSYDLAKHFLAGTPSADENDADELAQCIQDAVEDWFKDRENSAEAAWERRQEWLMEGGFDDSDYRQDMKDAGRGHLVKP